SDSSVEQLWNLEAIGIRDSAESKSLAAKEEETKQRFLETVGRYEDGRYKVNLPWIDGHQRIPDNRCVAERRLESTTKKLCQQGMVEAYDRVFRDWLNEGIIEEVNELEPTK